MGRLMGQADGQLEGPADRQPLSQGALMSLTVTA